MLKSCFPCFPCLTGSGYNHISGVLYILNLLISDLPRPGSLPTSLHTAMPALHTWERPNWLAVVNARILKPLHILTSSPVRLRKFNSFSTRPLTMADHPHSPLPQGDTGANNWYQRTITYQDPTACVHSCSPIEMLTDYLHNSSNHRSTPGWVPFDLTTCVPESQFSC